MGQKQEDWKERYCDFQEKEVKTKLTIGILGVLFGGVLIALPMGAIMTLTYGGIPPNQIAIRLSDAIMGGFSGIFGVLFFVGGVSMILDNQKELHRLDKLKSS